MKQTAQWISNLDLLKQKVQSQGTTLGFCCSIIFFLGSIVTAVFVIVNSYLPPGLVPGLGYKNTTKTTFNSLNLQPKIFTAFIKCSDTNGCLVVPLKKKNQIKGDPKCENVKVFTEKEISICYGYTYNFFLKDPLKVDNEGHYLYINFEDVHGFYGDNSGK
jgi:hypothetical protein